MAAIGKIRSWGPVLVTVIGLALMAFIAEEAFRSCNGIKGQASQQIGEVLGEKINVQDYQKLVDEFQNYIKVTTRQTSFTEDENNSLKDRVWQQLISNMLIEKEAKKSGLTVTEAELQNVLNEGTNPLLMQTPFLNQKTGRFDVTMLKQFLDSYGRVKREGGAQAEDMKSIYDYWMFVEKNLRTQLLGQKLESLLAACVLSNKVEAKMEFNDANEESQIQLASISYSTVKDADVKITDADLKAKYNELKPAFKQYSEARDIKYVDVQITATQADRNTINKEMNALQKELAEAADPATVVSRSASQVPYLGVPVSKNAFRQYPDIMNKIDSMSVGTSAVVENKQDNTLNIVRVLDKVSVPDSIEYRQIQVAAATVDEARTKADSIAKALEAGADFDALAKKYGQTGEKSWFTGDYENASNITADYRDLIKALQQASVNATNNLALVQGNIVFQVTDRKAITTKQTVAVIKKVIDFSKDTRSAAYNKFSEFVAKSTTLEELEKNAPKYGYKVQEATQLYTSSHKVAGIAATNPVLKWVFAAKEGEISPLYECGDNDHMLVAVLTKIHPEGYRSYDDPQVKETLQQEVLKDKKAETIMAKLQGVNSIAAAKAKGAKVSEVSQITFAAPTFITEIGAMETALSGAVAGTPVGKFSKQPVKGDNGVYLFQVQKRSKKEGAKFDEKEQMQRSCQQAWQMYLRNYMQDLALKAGIVDNRYLFF